MNVLEKKRGITLIALVVTIITILILAGVSINSIIGKNGIVERAQTTGKIQTVASIKEALELEKGDLLVNSKTVNLNNYLDQISNGDKKYEISYKEIIDDKNAEIIVDDKYKFALKDTEEGDVEVTYQGVAASSDLSISAKSGTYVYPNSGTFTVTNNVSGGELTVSSDATNIATATIEENTVTVVPGTTAGKANIIVKSSANGDYAENKVVHVATVQNGTIELSVTPYTGIYDGKAHDAITKINVNPTDAKIEYSIDGEIYSETVPTITETSSFTVTVRASKAGYKTQITTETVKVNKAEGKLTLSATSGTLTYPTSGMLTVIGNTGTLSVASSNTNIATASINGSTVTVKPGTTAGKATITVTSAEASNYNEKSATYEATVQNGTISLSATPYTGTYDGKVHNAFTSVNVTPSDAKLEYSINGGTYSTTMPTITNTSSFTVTVKASKAGYKTQIKTETVRVNKAAGTLTLSATSGTYTYPTSGTFTVSGNTGTLSVVSNNTNIATVSVSGNTVTVKPGTTAGKATITVTSAATTNYNAKSATYTATVNNGTISLSATPYTGTYDGKAHNAITKVTVTPSDAKIEYSTDGKTYSTTMPKITNTSSFTVTVRASKAGYKTQSTTQTVKVNKAAGTLTLSATSGTLMYPNTTTFTVSGNKGTLSVASSNTNVATASISGNTVTVKSGSTAGTATITVTSAATTNYNATTATYTVTISNVNTKKTYSDGDVWLPEGFRISKDSASTVKGGIVIEDKDLNQFVWVPVAMIADYKRTGYNGEYSEALPEDEKTSVKTYKGFYIGRYEAGDKESTEAKKLRSSNDVTKTVTIKANQAPYNYVTRTQAKSLAEGFKTQQGYKAKTKLVSSYAWDTTIAFLQKVNSDYGSSSKEGNYTNTTFSYTDITGARQTKARYSKVLVPTGQTTPVCNIYDMGGNVWEWTTESFSYPMYPYVLRGGGYGSSVDYSSR